MARSMPGAARLVLLLDAVFSAGRQAALVGQEKADDQTPPVASMIEVTRTGAGSDCPDRDPISR
jgi:hypothetical protein